MREDGDALELSLSELKRKEGYCEINGEVQVTLLFLRVSVLRPASSLISYQAVEQETLTGPLDHDIFLRGPLYRPPYSPRRYLYSSTLHGSIVVFRTYMCVYFRIHTRKQAPSKL